MVPSSTLSSKWLYEQGRVGGCGGASFSETDGITNVHHEEACVQDYLMRKDWMLRLTYIRSKGSCYPLTRDSFRWIRGQKLQ